jgi:hypothetical protein
MFDRKLVRKADASLSTAGERVYVDLDNNARTFGVMVTLSATYTMGTDVTGSALRNRGSLLAAISKIGIRMDGIERIICDGRTLGALQDIMSGGRKRRRDLATVVVTTAQSLVESVFVPASLFGLAVPSETALLEENTKVPVQLFLELASNAADAIAKKGSSSGTVTLGTVTAKVAHLLDNKRADLPLFRPIFREIVTPIPSDNSGQEISLRGSKYLAGVIIQQDSDIGEVTDMINKIQLIGDGGYSIIQQPTDWQHFVNFTQPQNDDGDPIAGYAYGMINFVDEGKLSHMLHPLVAPNLRLVLDAASSDTSGATNSKIRVTIIEMERHPQLTTPTLPFNV